MTNGIAKAIRINMYCSSKS